MEELMRTCGYIVSYFGAILEGEILLLTAVIATKMGYMNLFGALAAVFAGAYTRDWMTFLLARKKGKEIIEKKPKVKAKIKAISSRVDKNPTLFLSINRLMYGFSTIIILMSGMGNVSMQKFGILAAISSGLWVLIVGILGYFCADVMLQNIEWASTNSKYIIGILVVIGLSSWFFRKRNQLRC